MIVPLNRPCSESTTFCRVAASSAPPAAFVVVVMKCIAFRKDGRHRARPSAAITGWLPRAPAPAGYQGSQAGPDAARVIKTVYSFGAMSTPRHGPGQALTGGA